LGTAPKGLGASHENIDAVEITKRSTRTIAITNQTSANANRTLKKRAETQSGLL
jgi:hypothetical protein